MKIKRKKLFKTMNYRIENNESERGEDHMVKK